MTHQESNIVNAIFRKLNNDIRGGSLQVGKISVGILRYKTTDQDVECIEKFKRKIHDEDEEEALRFLKPNLEEVDIFDIFVDWTDSFPFQGDQDRAATCGRQLPQE